jgi:hypothetical protein
VLGEWCGDDRLDVVLGEEPLSNQLHGCVALIPGVIGTRLEDGNPQWLG